ncbi:sn-glycerol-1-phosphate dehydrogenase [Dongia deserti]|uniref:sn-glycerol-1-phosphate dehydrogenase n=1 Tax=Dongia deserti TaxID=2268030 RepID=UPI0013C4A65B|nr:sn-glycerol-1-phosphate dehydrogenase [Dongia deserti]
MPPDIIDRLIAGTYPDPDGGPPLRVQTRAVTLGRSLAGAEAELIRPLALGRRLAVVSDPTTHAVLGARVESALKSLGKVESVVLPNRPHADTETVARICAATRSADALIAVGSGTINDLCKYASACDRKPYAVFATAPSMNGYTSLNAAITVDGLKKSLPAQAPVGAFFDLSILAAAPVRMIRSGLGDSLCRSTAQTDWLLAHLLFDQPYRTMPFALLADDEPELFASAGAPMKGDLEAMEKLVRTLLLSGFGTAICGTSLPASQGEHLISHYGDMLQEPGRPFSLHGEQIGVTTLTMARLQGRMLDGPPPVVSADHSSEEDFIGLFGATLGRSCWKEFRLKRLTAEIAEAVNQRIASQWEEIRNTLAASFVRAEVLERVLREAIAPRAPEDLGWSRASYSEAVRHARKIRNRYTFLDFAADAGILESAIPEIA